MLLIDNKQVRFHTITRVNTHTRIQLEKELSTERIVYI